MPDFIALLRDIRDRMYVNMQEWYTTVQAITVGSTTNIDPIDGVVQPATVDYNPNTNEFDFGIPTSPVVDNTSATLVRTNGSTPMDTGYIPTVAKDVVTKEYVDLQPTWVNKFTGNVISLSDFYNTYGDGLFLVETISGEYVTFRVDASLQALGFEKIMTSENDLTFMVKMFISATNILYIRNYNVSAGTYTDRSIKNLSKWEIA